MSIETYKTLVRQYCPEIDIRNASLITDGWGSDVLDVNGEFIFRFPKVDWAEEQYAKEAVLLPTLARRFSFAVPNFEFDYPVTGQKFGRFVGYRKIVGEPLSGSNMKVRRLAWLLGTAVSEVHGFPVERAVQAGAPPLDVRSWLGEYEQEYRWLRENSFPLLSEPARVHSERLFEDFLSDESNFGFEPVLVHGDLGCEHILCDKQRGVINGIIDWGEVAIGDPANDFAALMVCLGRNLVEEVVASYTGTVDRAFWKRVEWYVKIFPYYDIIQGIKTGQNTALQAGLTSVIAAAES